MFAVTKEFSSKYFFIRIFDALFTYNTSIIDCSSCSCTIPLNLDYIARLYAEALDNRIIHVDLRQLVDANVVFCQKVFSFLYTKLCVFWYERMLSYLEFCRLCLFCHFLHLYRSGMGPTGISRFWVLCFG